MDLDFSAINYLAVIVAAVAHMVLGFLWYSPMVAGNAWVKATGKKAEDMKGSAGQIIGSVIMAIVIALILALLLQLNGATDMAGMDISDGILLGILVGLIVAAIFATNFFFEKGSICLYRITVGYHVIGILIMSIIISIWP